MKFRRYFSCFIFCKSLRPYHDILLAPNNQVRAPLRHTSLLCLAYKIVESIEGTLQSPIREHAAQARHRQHKQQHQYENSKDDLDQCKRSQTLHWQTYSPHDKSQHGQSDVFLVLSVEYGSERND